MPRKRTPVAVARITGQDVKHPERYSDRPNPPVRALGAPPERLTDDQKAEWNAFADEMPWLSASDRMIVELTSLLCVMVRKPDCPIGVFAQLRLCLSSMGGTPVDRSRVHWNADGDDDDPTSEFLN